MNALMKLTNLSSISIALIALMISATTLCALAQQPMEKGKLLYESRRYQEAEEVFAAVPKNENEYASAQYYLGLIAYERKQYKKAIGYFKKATEASPNDSEYFTKLGDSYSAFGWHEGLFTQMSVGPKALKSWEKAAKLNSTNISARVSLVGVYSVSPTLMGGGDAKARAVGNEAIVLLIAALKETPDNFVYQYWLGKVSAITGLKLEHGEAALMKYVAHTPKDGEPPLAGAYMRLGQIKEKQGAMIDAIKYYESALRLDENLKEAKEGLNRLIQ